MASSTFLTKSYGSTFVIVTRQHTKNVRRVGLLHPAAWNAILGCGESTKVGVLGDML